MARRKPQPLVGVSALQSISSLKRHVRQVRRSTALIRLRHADTDTNYYLEAAHSQLRVAESMLTMAQIALRKRLKTRRP